MHTTAETFCPQLFIVKDNEAMRYSNETTRYDKKDSVYEAPNYLESRFKRFAGVVKKFLFMILVSGFSQSLFGAVFNTVFDREMTGADLVVLIFLCVIITFIAEGYFRSGWK